MLVDPLLLYATTFNEISLVYVFPKKVTFVPMSLINNKSQGYQSTD